MLNAIAPETIQAPAGYGSHRRTRDARGSWLPSARPHASFDQTTGPPGMVTEIIDSIVVVAHGRAAPKQSEWDRMYELIESDSSVRGSIIAIHPKCPGPNAFQRRQGRTAWGRKSNANVALITTSAVHRGIITGFSWFLGNQMLAFSPAQWRNAMSHVGIGLETQIRILYWWHDVLRALGEPREYAAVGIDPLRWKEQLLPPDSTLSGDGVPIPPGSSTGGDLLGGSGNLPKRDENRDLASSPMGVGQPLDDGLERVAADRVPIHRSPKHMATSMLGRDDLLLIVHATSAPTQDEWDEHVAYMASLFERRPHRGVYCLVYSLGGRPNARQRREVLDITPPITRGKLAVLFGSSSLQGAPEDHSWIRGASVQVFGPGEYEGALSWLGIKSISIITVQDEVDRLLERLTRVANGP